MESYCVKRLLEVMILESNMGFIFLKPIHSVVQKGQ